jgi:hypothetical protein
MTGSVSISANETTAPDGNDTADLLIANNINSSFLTRQTISYTSGNIYC